MIGAMKPSARAMLTARLAGLLCHHSLVRKAVREDASMSAMILTCGAYHSMSVVLPEVWVFAEFRLAFLAVTHNLVPCFGIAERELSRANPDYGSVLCMECSNLEVSFSRQIRSRVWYASGGPELRTRVLS